MDGNGWDAFDDELNEHVYDQSSRRNGLGPFKRADKKDKDKEELDVAPDIVDNGVHEESKNENDKENENDKKEIKKDEDELE